MQHSFARDILVLNAFGIYAPGSDSVDMHVSSMVPCRNAWRRDDMMRKSVGLPFASLIS